MDAMARDLQTIFGMGTTGTLSDAQLLDRFLARREGAVFEAIVRRHGPMVWGVCRRVLRDHHDAEDAFQATFLVLARRAASVMPPERLGNWLYGVAYQTARKARATRAKRRAREGQVPDVPEPMAAPDDARDELVESLDRELSRLPEKFRIPIVLCDLEGRTHQEAASQLGWPIGTVSSRLSRGRSMLARRLSQRSTPLSVGLLAEFLTQESASARVPTQLIGPTARAASLLAAGGAVMAGVVPAAVDTLTGEVLKMMLFSKLKIAMAVVLGVSLLPCGMLAAGRPDRTQAAMASAPPFAVAEDPRPHKRDSRIPRPKYARLTPSAIPRKLEPGQTFTYDIKVSLDDGWRVFPFSTEQPEEGPSVTRFDFFDTGGFEVAGEWQASRPATVLKRPAVFPDLPTVECFEEEVTWSIRLKVPRGMEAGEKTLRCQASYQLMNERSVTAPGRWTLDEVRVQVSR
jgi:RNA polymerase sigma factor (sigma-70 family)